MYSGIFTQLNDDSYAPTVPKLDLQQWDNYGIYSLACINSAQADLDTRYNYEKVADRYTVTNGSLVSLDPFVTYPPIELNPKFGKFLAFQTCNVTPIPVDFRQYVETYHSLGNTEIKTYQYAEITEVP
jgi:hypothetical protein